MIWNSSNCQRYPRADDIDGHGTAIAIDDVVDVEDLYRHGFYITDLTGSEVQIAYIQDRFVLVSEDSYEGTISWYFESGTIPPPDSDLLNTEGWTAVFELNTELNDLTASDRNYYDDNKGIFRDIAIKWRIQEVYDRNIADIESGLWDGNVEFRAVIDSTATGNWNVGATWVGGVVPGPTDDARVMNTHNVTLTMDQTGANATGSLEVQVGGTITGGGFDLQCADENAVGYLVDIDGGVGGNLDLLLTQIGGTKLDLVPSGGSVRDITINADAWSDFWWDASWAMSGDLTLTAGKLYNIGGQDASTVGIGENLQLAAGTYLGIDTWTGNLTIGGNMSGTGAYRHGPQECEFNGGFSQITGSDWTFYDLTANTGGPNSLEVYDNARNMVVTVEHTLTSTSGWFDVTAEGRNCTLVLGTASASGTISNSSGVRPRLHAGVGNTYFYAASASYYANLEGAGVYDWDHGTSNGEVHWKWLNMKSTNATSKSSGGGGVTIVLDANTRFYEDWTVASGDTFNINNIDFTIIKSITRTGTLQNVARLDCYPAGATGIIKDWSSTGLKFHTNSAYSFDGTVTVGLSGVGWGGGSTGDFLPYDSTSILNVAGGITVPASTYFGADAAGNMGDGNPASGWTADMSWGFVNAYDNTIGFTTSSGNTTITSYIDANSCIRTANGADYNNGTITITTTADRLIVAGGDLASGIYNLVITSPNTFKIAGDRYIRNDVTISNGGFRSYTDITNMYIIGTLSMASGTTFGHNTWAPSSDVTIGAIDCNAGEIYFPAQSGGGDMIINGSGFSIDTGSTVHHDNGHVQFVTNGACAVDCTHELYDVTFNHAALVANTHYINAGNSYTFTAIQEMAGASTGYVVGADITSLPTMIITDMNYCGVTNVTTGGGAVTITLNTKGFFKNLTVSLNDTWTSNGNMKKCGTGGTWTVDGTWNVNADAYAWDINNTGTITVAGGVSVYYFGTFTESGAGSHTGTISIYSVLHDVQLTDVQFTGG